MSSSWGAQSSDLAIASKKAGDGFRQPSCEETKTPAARLSSPGPSHGTLGTSATARERRVARRGRYSSTHIFLVRDWFENGDQAEDSEDLLAVGFHPDRCHELQPEFVNASEIAVT